MFCHSLTTNTQFPRAPPPAQGHNALMMKMLKFTNRYSLIIAGEIGGTAAEPVRLFGTSLKALDVKILACTFEDICNAECGAAAANLARIQCSLAVNAETQQECDMVNTLEKSWDAAARTLPSNIRRALQGIASKGIASAGTTVVSDLPCNARTLFAAALRRLEDLTNAANYGPGTAFERAARIARRVLHPDSVVVIEADPVLQFFESGQESAFDLLRRASERGRLLADTLEHPDGWTNFAVGILHERSQAALLDLTSDDPSKVLRIASDGLPKTQKGRYIKNALRILTDNHVKDEANDVKTLLSVAFEQQEYLVGPIFHLRPNACDQRSKRISALGELMNCFLHYTPFKELYEKLSKDDEFDKWRNAKPEKIENKYNLGPGGAGLMIGLSQAFIEGNLDKALVGFGAICVKFNCANTIGPHCVESAVDNSREAISAINKTSPIEMFDGLCRISLRRRPREALQAFVSAVVAFRRDRVAGLLPLLRCAWELAEAPPLWVDTFPLTVTDALMLLPQTPEITGIQDVVSRGIAATNFNEWVAVLADCKNPFLQDTLPLVQELHALLQSGVENDNANRFRRAAAIIRTSFALYDAAGMGDVESSKGLVYVMQAFCGLSMTPAHAVKTFHVAALFGLAEIYFSGKGNLSLLVSRPVAEADICDVDWTECDSESGNSVGTGYLTVNTIANCSDFEHRDNYIGDFPSSCGGDGHRYLTHELSDGEVTFGDVSSRNVEESNIANANATACEVCHTRMREDASSREQTSDLNDESETATKEDTASQLSAGGKTTSKPSSSENKDPFAIAEDSGSRTDEIIWPESIEEISDVARRHLLDPGEFSHRWDKNDNDQAASEGGTWTLFPADGRVQTCDPSIPQPGRVDVNKLKISVDDLENRLRALREDFRVEYFPSATLQCDVITGETLVSLLPRLQKALEMASSTFYDVCRMAQLYIQKEDHLPVAVSAVESGVNTLKLADAIAYRTQRLGLSDLLASQRENLRDHLRLLPSSVLGAACVKDLFPNSRMHEVEDFDLSIPEDFAAHAAAPRLRARFPEKTVPTAMQDMHDILSDAGSEGSLREFDFTDLTINIGPIGDADAPATSSNNPRPATTNTFAHCPTEARVAAQKSGTRNYRDLASYPQATFDGTMSGEAELGLLTPEEALLATRMQGGLDFQLSKQHIYDQCGKGSLADLYKKAKASAKDRTVGMVADALPEKKVTPEHKWTYEMLVESSALSRISALLCEEVRSMFETHYQDTRTAPMFEFCLLFDNSGSMIRLANQVQEALVLLIETLRKLECRFAVARFGNKRGQRLLKQFDQPFSSTLGEQILNSFTYNESTHTVSGVEAVAQKLWPRAPSGTMATCTQRVMLLVTDGLSQEMNAENFQSLLDDKKFAHFAVLSVRGRNLKDEAHLKSIDKLLQEVTNGLHTILHYPEEADAFATLLGELMKKVFGQATKNICSARAGPEEIQLLPASCSANAPIKPLTLPQTEGLGFRISHSSQILPFSASASECAITPCVVALTESSTEPPADGICAAQEEWARFVSACGPLLEDFSDALETVSPINQHTRRRRDVRGSQLDPQGLMKAMATEWSYKKFFSSKTGGGRRKYAFALVVDVSQSMCGALADNVQSTLVLLIEALRKLTMEFAVLTYGENIHVAKSFDDEWSPTVLAQILYETARYDSPRSNDADAIYGALHILSLASGAKRLFVLTDGHGSCGIGLTNALKEAEAQSVEVVALAVGEEKSCLPQRYQRWIQAARCADVPNAMRELYERTDAHAQGAEPEWMSIQTTGGTTQDVWGNPGSQFPDLSAELRGEREVKLIHGSQPTHLCVDLCFVLDVTGSMSAWLEAAKAQIVYIVTSIVPKIQEDYPDLSVDIRAAVIPFRDFDDADHLAMSTILSFTDDVALVVQHVRKQEARGGGDIPEDVVGALNAVANLPWASPVRFAILITDAPSHGNDFNDDPTDAHAPRHDGKAVLTALQSQSIDLMFCRIKQQATAKMESFFRKHYDRPDDGKTMEVVNFADGANVPTGHFHLVFILDESSSMSGQPWADLMHAYQLFLQRRTNDQGNEDIVSVITFDGSPRQRCTATPLASAPRNFGQSRGGTEFSGALSLANTIIGGQQGYTPLVIFMSDGCDSSSSRSQANSEASRLVQYSSRGLQAHFIAFGRANHQRLQQLANACSGKFHASATGMDLASTFVQIATQCTAFDGLVRKFGERISSAVCNKLMLEYL
eukprot:GEMP01000165.1.p1 GENE.GEMP01000165.1~~GEMP01000165.1.p1  ORF type:complete len:2228 (+),score=410.75 GEMP01000165.1:779-7462(+)